MNAFKEGEKSSRVGAKAVEPRQIFLLNEI
jgi:hypothetical protein